LLRNQSSALLLPPGVAGDAIEAGLPRLAMLRQPPPGVAGLRMLFVSDDEAMLSPPGLPASPSEPLVLPLLEKAATEEEEDEAAATAAWR
jgi:hypothetical protein